MSQILATKRIILGVTGSIACYKALDLASKLTQLGALVNVVMTHNATKFVSPLSFSSLTNQSVVTDLFDPEPGVGIKHITLAEQADLVVVAPATAQCIAKIALGLADDSLTTAILATKAPIIIAPAMDGHMFENPATQENLNKLKGRGIVIVGPDQGRLASGITGIGRLVESHELLGHIRLVIGAKGDLTNTTIVVSAGGTREPLDPARLITNRSSGKMGYALAEAARDRGAHTILITAATNPSIPVGVDVIHVETALEMRDEVAKASAGADALVMAAAVSDYRPKSEAHKKLKKDAETITIELVRNPDIISEVGHHLVKVGFAAESENLAGNAKTKLAQKGLDMIVANNIIEQYSGFDSDTNKVIILDKHGTVEDTPLMPKEDVAHRVLDRMKALMDAHGPTS